MKYFGIHSVKLNQRDDCGFYLFQKMVESECDFYGSIMLKEENVLKIDECVQLNELLQGQFYVYDSKVKECTVYNSSARNCRIQRGVNDKFIKPSMCPK